MSPPAARGIIVALPGEAGRLRRRRAPASRLYLSGVGPERARRSAERALEDGCTLLVSWGSAAGLDPGLGCGDLVVARQVWIREHESLAAPAEVIETLADRLPGGLGWRVGDLAHTARVLDSPAAKRELRRRSGALLADMETAAIAAVAVRSGVAWGAVRVVVDTADRAICTPVVRALEPGGELRLGRMAWEGMKRPGELGSLLRLARAFGRARGVLEEAADALGW